MFQEKIKNLEKLIIDEYNNISGIVILKNGEKLYEKYFNDYNSFNTVHIASVTKSIFSALIGIAIDNGYIKSINQKILDFFPEYKIENDENTIQDITIKNILTMTAPYKCETEPYEEFFISDNWINFSLNLLGGHDEIGNFRYSPIVGIHILSGILVKSTKQSILDFASKNLFLPLGIQVEKNISLHSKEDHIAFYKEKNIHGWAIDPQGINTAGWGLTLSPTDMAKIGQLYLSYGQLENKQIVPSQWIEESTRKQSQWGDLSYGYLWWIIDNKKHIYAALGDGGNVIYVNNNKNIVISIASTFIPNAKDRIELIEKHIEPIF